VVPRLRSKTPKRPTTARVVRGVDGHLRVVYTANEIRQRVRQLARQINRDYKGKTVHVVGVLESCFVFMADLVRALRMPVVCHFVKTEMADATVEGIPVREIRYTPGIEAAGKEVLLLNGVLYSGVTLDYLYRYVQSQGPNSVRTDTLIEKTDAKKVDVATDYVGFQTQGGFLVGYGLGHQGRYQNLPCIATLAPAAS